MNKLINIFPLYEGKKSQKIMKRLIRLIVFKVGIGPYFVRNESISFYAIPGYEDRINRLIFLAQKHGCLVLVSESEFIQNQTDAVCALLW